MALIAKMHPTQNWLRVPDRIFRQALERNIKLGKPDNDHFWTAELPRLISDPYILKQVEERRAELQEKLQRLEGDLRQIAGGLIEEHSICEEQLALLDEVLA
jgi:hypothetical protein